MDELPVDEAAVDELAVDELPLDELAVDEPRADGQSAGAPLPEGSPGDVTTGAPSETDRLLAETLTGAGLPAEGIAGPPEEHAGGMATSSRRPDGRPRGTGSGIADADHTLDDTSEQRTRPAAHPRWN